MQGMQKNRLYPALGNRMSPKEWEEADKPGLLERARVRKEAILSTPSPVAFDPALDATLRARFNIHLAR